MASGSLVEANEDGGKADIKPAKEPVSEQPATTDAPYSVFSVPQKRMIVLTASLGAVFSPMATTIYLPALNQLSRDLHVSSTLINLTVTTFLILQGLAPMMIAGFSDTAGRRPAYMFCFIVFIAANIGLAIQRNYAALMVLRCVQSTGSSGTVALATGVVADLITSAERGMYMAYTSVPIVIGPIVGPILGGVIAQYLGWWWIFWVLALWSGTHFVLQFLFLPETCRKVVGDGSIPPPLLNQSVTDFVREKNRVKAGHVVNTAQLEYVRKNYKLTFPNPLSTLTIASDKEAALILFCGGLVICLFYAVNTGIPSQFGKIYGFDELRIGLVFIPFGGGGFISAFTTGKMIDLNYRRHAKANGFPLTKNRYQDLTDFPIERARLEVAMPLLYLAVVSLIGYGWVLNARTNLAGPLVMLFLFGYGSSTSFQVLQILMVDITPGQAAAATAANNLFRCLLGAGSTAVVVPMINRMGVGWAYTLLALLWVCFSPMLWSLTKYGPIWRKAKKEKSDAKQDKTTQNGEQAIEKPNERSPREETEMADAIQGGQSEEGKQSAKPSETDDKRDEDQ
ncbi:hypothetical protein ACLMJK_006989 [Lecanora helva]